MTREQGTSEQLESKPQSFAELVSQDPKHCRVVILGSGPGDLELELESEVANYLIKQGVQNPDVVLIRQEEAVDRALAGGDMTVPMSEWTEEITNPNIPAVVFILPQIRADIHAMGITYNWFDPKGNPSKAVDNIEDICNKNGSLPFRVPRYAFEYEIINSLEEHIKNLHN